MNETAAKIRFKARLLKPAEPAKNSTWAFLVLPMNASAQLPTRGTTAVEGVINGHAFRAVLEPNGKEGHWLKVNRRMREGAGADVGDVVTLELGPARKEPEPRVPADLKKALTANPRARATWSAITTVARRDWILWITSARRPDTRARRIRNGCDMLATGKRRVCCFDRSGFYSKEFCAPVAASG